MKKIIFILIFIVNFARVSFGQSDFCSTATPYTACSMVSGTTTGATANTGSGQDDSYSASYICAGSMENTVWYTFTAPAAGIYTLNYCASSCTSGWGVQTGVLSGSCGGPYTSLDCSYVSNGTCTAYDITMTAGQQVYLVIDGDAGDECNFTLDGNCSLPITMLGINVECTEDGALLTWSTASEINNDYFTIEKSIDAENFYSIGTVKGQGNSNGMSNYSFVDEDVGDNYYYRLKQTDFDGSFEYFNIVSIQCKGSPGFTVYPNPFNDELVIEMPDLDEYALEIRDYLGRAVLRKDLSGYLTQKLNLGFLPTQGIFFVSLYDNNGGLISVKKIFKQ